MALEGEWNGLDALLAAKPIDLNGVRDSEYFGGPQQRMSFYMSPPKETPATKPASKFERTNTTVGNKENRANNAFLAEMKSESAKTALPKYTKRLFDEVNVAVPASTPLSASLPSSTAEKPPMYHPKDPAHHEPSPSIPATPSHIPPSTPSSSVHNPVASSKPSGLVKPRAKSSTLSSSYLSTPSSSLSTPAATPSSTSFSTPLSIPSTPVSTSSFTSSKTMASPGPTRSGIPSYSSSSSLKSTSVLSELNTPARPPLSQEVNIRGPFEKESRVDELAKRIAKLEEENKQLRQTVEQSASDKEALSQKVTALEDKLENFMVEVKVVLLTLKI